MVNTSILIEKNTLAEKQCNVCRQVLPITKFRKYKHQSGFGYRGSCRQCERARERKRRQQKTAQLGINNTLVERQCSVCGRVLPITNFRRYENQNGSFEYRYSCRECEKEQNRKRRQQRTVQLGIKNTPVEKQCGVCKQVLPIVKFRRYENRSGTFGYRGSCRECERAQGRESYRQEQVQSSVNTEEKEDNYRFLNFYKKVKSGF